MKAKMAILSSYGIYTAAAQEAAELLEAEPILVSADELSVQEAAEAIIATGCQYAAIHGHYDHKFSGTYVAKKVVAQSVIEVVLIGSSLGWSNDSAKESRIAFADYSPARMVALLIEGREARITREIQRITEAYEKEIARLLSLLSTTAPESG